MILASLFVVHLLKYKQICTQGWDDWRRKGTIENEQIVMQEIQNSGLFPRCIDWYQSLSLFSHGMSWSISHNCSQDMFRKQVHSFHHAHCWNAFVSSTKTVSLTTTSNQRIFWFVLAVRSHLRSLTTVSLTATLTAQLEVMSNLEHALALVALPNTLLSTHTNAKSFRELVVLPRWDELRQSSMGHRIGQKRDIQREAKLGLGYIEITERTGKHHADSEL